MENKYWMRLVKGALIDPKMLDKFPHEVLEVWADDPNWEACIGAELTLEEIHEVQKQMIKHHESSAPWYMDGWRVDDKNQLICAFGADDGEGGRIFEFKRDDKKAFQEVLRYAISKGIPKEQMDFLEIP